MEPLGSSKQRVSCLEVDDLLFPPNLFTVEKVKSALNYKARPDDTFIVTYPKCGTTWMQYIVWDIVNQASKTPATVDEMKYHLMPFMDMCGAEAIEKLTPPRYIVTHLPHKALPYHEKAKYVYMARNPRDCCVSYFHFIINGKKIYMFDGTFEDYFECFLSGGLPYGDYYAHVKDWYERRNDSNVHFVTYEELKVDPASAILNLARFLGHHEPLERDSTLVQKIVERTSFEAMKSYTFQVQGGNLDGAEISMFRKGIVGDWKSLMTEEMVDRVDEKMVDIFGGTELAKHWKRK